MVKNRKGLGKGQGTGFKNIIPNQDAKTHANNAKGIKQPQKLNVDALIRQSKAKGQFYDVADIQKPTKDTTDVENIGAETKTEAFFKRTAEKGKKGLEFAKQQLAKVRERQKEKKIKVLEEIDHPLARKLESQEKRVAELKEQIALNDESDKPEQEQKLFDELAEEQEQLREVQEKATELDLSRLSDAELKTLAIRHPDDTGFLSGLFGDSEDKYTAELVKRIQRKKSVEKKLKEARKEKSSSSESSTIGGDLKDLFSF